MYKKPTNKKKEPFNWKKWLYILIGILLFFPVVRFVIRQYNKFNSLENEIDKENQTNEVHQNFIQNQNPIVAQNKADKITVRKDVQAAAKELVHHLGIKYQQNPNAEWLGINWSFLDPRGWTENDKKVADILIYQRLNYSLLKRLYNEVYTKGNKLNDDVLALVDETELKRIQAKLNLN